MYKNWKSLKRGRHTIESFLLSLNMTTTDHLTFNANWHERGLTKFIEECSGKNEGIITLNTCLAQAFIL